MHATDDRLAVIYFQEDRVEVAVPFTRNQLLLKNGLRSIKPSGLTPLALGLLTAARYVSKYSCRERSLLIVITDGIPTMALASGDPMEEVLQQAKDIGRQRINLCCVGLQPNQRLLSRLAEAARGKRAHHRRDYRADAAFDCRARAEGDFGFTDIRTGRISGGQHEP
ncbi:MAG: hypothetical protein DDT20_00214 [Firmicutes bacterium]|nr:hypothetical protein [Bacillota bacterium]